jgi:hypothetical protein
MTWPTARDRHLQLSPARPALGANRILRGSYAYHIELVVRVFRNLAVLRLHDHKVMIRL